MCRIATKSLSLLSLLVLSLSTFSQTDYTSNLSSWKTLFPKEDVIAYSYKETVNFALNPSPKPGEGNVKATVINELVVVPVKDFMKYQDGLFYNDEISIDNVKATNTKGKDLAVQKLCASYQSEDIFHSDSKLCTVQFPMEEKGKSLSFRYDNSYRDIKYLTSFYFQHHMPAVERTIEFNIPSWLELDLREFNFKNAAIEKKISKEGDITKITFTTKNIAAWQSEPSSPNHALSSPHIICVNKAYTENGQRKILFESVKDLYGWYSKVCEDIGNKPDELKSRVAALTANKKTDIEKIESIFYWVQDNIRYIAFEDGIMGFKPDAAQNVLNKKYGDCKGKANLLKEMLRIAGYDARLTWIGTSDLPYDYTLPSLAVDNHMICTVILNGKKYFLDGTEYFIAFNDYAQRIQGKQVLIEDGKNYIVDKIPDFSADRNKVKRVTTLTVDNDVLQGKTSVEYNGESKLMLHGIYSTVRSEEKKDALSAMLRQGDDNIIVNNIIKGPDFTERQKPITVSYDFKANNQVKRAGKEIYVVMDWTKDFSGYEFDNDRKNDYEFNFKYNINIQTELMIPEGYKVDYLPPALKKATPQYSFEGSYVNKGRSVVYTKTITVNKPILFKSEFANWNAFIKDINNFYNDQVVLVKQ
jgi:transglutaminase-like putative cysteine protease